MVPASSISLPLDEATLISGEHPSIQTWLRHIHVIAGDIGPRGSTTDAERRASDYCAQILDKLDLAPQVETFISARSIFTPHIYAALAMLASFAIYPLAGPTSAGLAAALALVALVSDLLELSFRDNLWRRLAPKGRSQNVVAVLRPAERAPARCHPDRACGQPARAVGVLVAAVARCVHCLHDIALSALRCRCCYMPSGRSPSGAGSACVSGWSGMCSIAGGDVHRGERQPVQPRRER
jgi:hypothetical protein